MPSLLRPLALLCAALLAAPLAAQEIKMPQSVVAPIGRLSTIELTYDGDDLAYTATPGIDVFREFTTDAKLVRLRILPYEHGTFQISAVTCKSVDGLAKLSPFQTCLVQTSTTPPPIIPGPVVPPVTPPVTPTPAPTAATYIYDKDKTAIPVPVKSAIDKINREKKIVATFFEDSTVDGTGQTPEQYKSALFAASSAGLPALVVTVAPGVFRIVKDPQTEEAVLEAVK